MGKTVPNCPKCGEMLYDGVVESKVDHKAYHEWCIPLKERDLRPWWQRDDDRLAREKAAAIAALPKKKRKPRKKKT